MLLLIARQSDNNVNNDIIKEKQDSAGITYSSSRIVVLAAGTGMIFRVWICGCATLIKDTRVT